MGDLPPLAELVTIPDLAERKGVPYRTLHRDLLLLWQRDVAEGGGDWLVRLGRRRKMWVNVSRLRVAHPALFEQRYVDRADFEAVRGDVAALAKLGRELKQRQNALAANLREVREALKRCQTMQLPASGGGSS